MYRFMTKRNQKEFQEKIQKFMAEKNIDSLILTTPQNVFYATGYISPFLYGRMGSIGSEIAIVNSEGKVNLVVSQFTQGGAEEQTKGDVLIHPYPTWIFIEDYYNENEKEKDIQPDLYKTFRMAVDIIKKHKANAKVAVEENSLSYDKYVFLQKELGAENICSATQLMIDVRTIKFKWEIDVLREAANITEKMMLWTMLHTQAGMCEADIMKIWFQAAYEYTGGHEIVEAFQWHTPGPDFWATSLPRERILQKGDIVRLDGGINLCGYGSDLGRTFVIGDSVLPERQKIFDTLLEARDAGLALMKPGNRAGDIFDKVMDVCHKGALPQYVRGHVGHTIGCGPGEEYPMLGKGSDLILRPGMVFCFETPYYSSKYGSYNLEDTLLITEDGHELFSDTNRNLILV